MVRLVPHRPMAAALEVAQRLRSLIQRQFITQNRRGT